MEPISPQPGSARDSRHFVGRAQTHAVADRKLRNGTNLLLNDPRRMGKSYWLTAYTSRTADFTSVVIDYEGVSSQEEFLLRTVDALRKSEPLKASGLLARLGSLFKDVEVAGGPVKIRVAFQQRTAASLLADVLRAAAESVDRTLLICMDEVPLAILNIARGEGSQPARELLQTLRLLRQSEPGIRWILSGSVGFHHVLEVCGSTEGDLNDLDGLPLGPLAEDEAIELAQRLLLGIDRAGAEGAVSRLIERTGGIPYLLHKVASLLDNGTRAAVTTDEVDEAFEDFIDEPDEFRAFAHILTRLEPTYGDDAGLARRILDGALSPDGAWSDLSELRASLGDPDRFAAVLDDLVSDHYLVQRGRRIRWRYLTLQYIWARRGTIWDRPS